MIKLATIAGSDASGGAGLEADLKTFQEYGVYGMAAVTVIATMNPDKEWGHEVFPIDEQAIRAQLETIFKGIGVNAAKTGMLATNYAVELSAEYLKKYNVENYVLDPVMVCKGGDLALNPELNNLIIKKLLPLAKLITPNLFEAGQIAKMPTPSTIEEIIRTIVDKVAEDNKMVSEQKNEIIKNILKREEEITTAIGKQIAIPHAIGSFVKESFVYFIRLKHPIDFNAIDKENVRLFFVIGMTETQTIRTEQVVLLLW